MNWTPWLGFVGGGGAGGGLVSFIRITWKDKKQIEKEYYEYRADVVKFVAAVEKGYSAITDKLDDIDQKVTPQASPKPPTTP